MNNLNLSIDLEEIPLNEISTKGYETFDESGWLFEWKGELYRAIHPKREEKVLAVLSNPIVKELVAKGWIQNSELTHYRIGNSSLVLRHKKLTFLTHPYEWSDAMVRKVAHFALDLAGELMEAGIWIYDLKARNFAFKGNEPIFLDILAIDTFNSSYSYASSYISSFYAEFLNRVMLASKGVGYIGRAICFYGESVNSRKVAISWSDKIKLKLIISIKNSIRKLKRSPKPASENHVHPLPLRGGVSISRFRVFKLILFLLRIRLKMLRPYTANSSTVRYYEVRKKDKKYFDLKEKHITQFLTEAPISRVLDVASNTGHFSSIALNLGHEVMSFDVNSACVDFMFSGPSSFKKNVAILDFYKLESSPKRDLALLKPALERWKSEIVLFLAYSHHVVERKKLSYEELFAVLNKVCLSKLIFEYVPVQDCYGSLRGCSRDNFKEAVSKYFVIENLYELDLGRELYVLKKISS